MSPRNVDPAGNNPFTNRRSRSVHVKSKVKHQRAATNADTASTAKHYRARRVTVGACNLEASAHFSEEECKEETYGEGSSPGHHGNQ